MRFKQREVMKAIRQSNFLGMGSVRRVYGVNDQLVVKVSGNGYACRQTLAELYAYHTLPEASIYCTWVGTTKCLLKMGIIVAERVESLESYLDKLGVDTSYLDEYDLMEEDNHEGFLDAIGWEHTLTIDMLLDFLNWAMANGVYDLRLGNIGVRPGTNQVVLLDLGFGSESTGGLMYTGEREEERP